MFYCLNTELKYRSTWVVVGYSFRDPIIRNIFVTNFNRDKKMILIDPSPESALDRLGEYAAQIHVIKERFGGNNNYQEINDHFCIIVSFLKHYLE
jgi:hypothetical protein